MPSQLADHTLIILSGGQGRRMDGQDKGLLTVEGNGFVAVLARRLHCQPLGLSSVVVSANRHKDVYRQLGVRVAGDERPGHQGPLAGLEAALGKVSGCRPVVVVPCDMPLLPSYLPVKLLSCLRNHPTDIVMVHDGQRIQPLCLAFYPDRWRASVTAYLDSGCRAVKGWLDGKPVHQVNFPQAEDFENINSFADYRKL